MKEKSARTVIEKKILKTLMDHKDLSENKIASVLKMPRNRCVDPLDALVENHYLNLQDEKYEITPQGIGYLEEMMKRDKRGRQSRRQLTGRN